MQKLNNKPLIQNRNCIIVASFTTKGNIRQDKSKNKLKVSAYMLEKWGTCSIIILAYMDKPQDNFSFKSKEFLATLTYAVFNSERKVLIS